MSYRCGVGLGMASIGFAPRDPHIVCDGCGATHPVAKMGIPRQWFLNGKPPPKWKGKRVENPDGSIARMDYCRTCTAAGKASGEYLEGDPIR